ncbi:MAG: 2-amino-4-hydroxy-6-hydroxymethyldihydropteridine diphosphokinase [Armatimonadota bacterium]
MENIPVTAYLGLGSNIGDRVAFIREAIDKLSLTEGIRVKVVSSLYETEPVGYIDQPDFINCVVEIETENDLYQLLKEIHKIENAMGRVRNIKWGPRIIDIDILIFGDIRLKTDELEIPHPRMLDRSFVMIPLLEIANESILKQIGIATDYNHLADEKTIRKL